VLPITLNPRMVRIGVTGAGDGLARRMALLSDSGVEAISVAVASSDAAYIVCPHCLSPASAGLPRQNSHIGPGQAASWSMSKTFRSFAISTFRRLPAGQLTLTVSTGGRAPAWRSGCANVANPFRTGVDEHIETIGSARSGWRADCLAPDEVSQRTPI